MKKCFHMVLLLFIAVVIIMLLIAYKDLSYPPVQQALSYKEAMELCNSEDWLIIRPVDISGGREFVFYNGKYAGKYVDVVGLSRRKKLSTVFWWDASMKILVKVSELKKVDISDRLVPINYQIDIYEWELISPIKRDYTYSKHERLFAPQNYIDEYDVIHGDYKIVD